MPLCFLVVCVFHRKTQKPTKTRECSLAKFSSFGLKTLELFRALHVITAEVTNLLQTYVWLK